jgi:predicted dehydrogenase
MIMASLDKGCHVLTEKPMVCTVQHAKDVIRKVEETQKSLMVSYQRHLQSEFRYLRNQIMAGELGKIRFINALQDQDWYLGTMGAWRQDPSLSGGGQLNDSGSHLLDIVLWMTDLEVDELQAYIQNYESKVDIDSAMSVRFRGGALGNISIVGSSPASGMWEDITIWGDKAVAYMRNGKITIKGLYSKDAYEPTGLPGGTSPDRHFVDALMGRDTIQVPATCGLRVIELTEAAWESGRTGKPVKVKR